MRRLEKPASGEADGGKGSAKRAMAKVRERFTECVLLLYVDMPIIIGLSLVLVYFSLVISSIHIMNE